jgi:VIT1/CCC1 family predicted Fe2+/Mn2+ transporter
MRRAIEAHLDSLQVSRVIYGAIIGLALVVALEPHPPSAVAVAASLLATALAVALAELYSELVGAGIRHRRGVPREHTRAIVSGVVAVAFGAGFPAVFFIVAAVSAMEVGTAFTLAKWSGLALIACYGFAAARLSGAGLTRSVGHAAAVGAIGAALIGFKALIH